MSDKGTETRYDEWVHDSPYGHLHLRDLFAAFALAGLAASKDGGEVNPQWIAAKSYDFADAMLAQRTRED